MNVYGIFRNVQMRETSSDEPDIEPCEPVLCHGWGLWGDTAAAEKQCKHYNKVFHNGRPVYFVQPIVVH